MSDPAPRANHQLPLTRNHLYALGALSLSVAVLAFFVGFSLGRAGGPPPSEPVVLRLIPDDVRTGDLEVLLARVEETSNAEMTMGFPAELPRTDPPPVVVEPLAEGAVAPPPEPVPAPFPTESRPGTAAIAAAAAVAPTASADIPTSGWSLQVSEHSGEADAIVAVEALRAAELPAYSVVAIVEGEVRWRVRVGGYGSKEAATGAATELAAKAGVASATVTMAP